MIGIYPLHFGHLAPWEQALVYLLGFGPFLLLFVVIRVVRGHEDATEDEPVESHRAESEE